MVVNIGLLIILIILFLISIGQLILFFRLRKIFFLFLSLSGILLCFTGYFFHKNLVPFYVSGVIFFISLPPYLVYRRKIKDIYFNKVNFIYKIFFPIGLLKKDYIDILKNVNEVKKGDKFFLVNGIIAIIGSVFFLLFYNFKILGIYLFFVCLFFGSFFILYYIKNLK